MNQEEKKLFGTFMAIHPRFLEAASWKDGPDPPDVIITDVHGRKLGVELTAWLDEKQTTESITVQENEFRWLEALDAGHHPQPKHFERVQISFYPETRFLHQQRASFREKFFVLVDHVDKNWDDLFGNTRQKIWNDFKNYPTLRPHIRYLSFDSPLILRPRSPGARWIFSEPKGGLYDPRWATQALLDRINNKTNKENYIDLKSQHGFTELVLLLHRGLRGIMHNTPFDGVNWKLENSLDQARAELVKNPGRFDQVFLYFAYNEGKLIRLYP